MTQGVLSGVRSRIGAWLAARSLLAVAAAAGLLAFVAVLADAALDLPEPVRVAAPWILTGASLIILFTGIRDWCRLSETRVARMFERHDPALGTRLTNAVQLAGITSVTPIGEFLRSGAVERGRSSAAGLRSWPVVRRGLQFTTAALAGMVIAWISLILIEPGMMSAVAPRFLDPRGDHPPFSRLKITVSPESADVLYGGQVDVRATASGRPVEKLWLVSRAGTNESRSLMFLAPEKSFFQSLANLREPAEYFVTDGSARSRRFPIRIRYTPQITLIEMTAHFPDYTGRPTRQGRLGDDTQAFPEGTRVSFRVASNRPLKDGSLTLIPVLGGKAAEVLLKPGEQPTMVSGEFVLEEAVAFTISVRDVEELPCAEPRRGRLNIQPDERPRLYVVEPGRDAVATPAITIPVRVQASDDYGVSRVVWLRGHNRSIERPFNMPITLRGGAQSVESIGAFDLEKLGVRPGDVIEYYFEAADTYPKGPNVTLSRPFRLEIISQEDYQTILRQQAARKALFEPYFKLGTWLQRLAERARRLEAADPSDSATRAEAAAIAEELEKYERELGKLLQHPAMFDVEQAFRTELVAQHTGVRMASSRLRKMLGGQLDANELKTFSEEMNHLAQAEEEQVGEPARHIASVVQVLSRANGFVKLAQQQAVLARMLQRFAEQTTPLSRLEQMEVQELAHHQRRIEEGLRTLMSQLPELLARVPADPEYDPLRRDVQEFLAACEGARITEDLAGSATLLAEADTMTGHVLAQRAAEKMDRLIARCDGLPGPGQAGLTARFSPTLNNSGLNSAIQQILAAMSAGSGEGGQDGYGLFNDDVALYGPSVELAGEQAQGRGDPGRSEGRRVEKMAGDAADPGLPLPDAPGRVQMQTDARFPLRYRELVGEYFRAIAEADEKGSK